MKSTENSSLYLNRYNRLNDPIRDEIVVLELNSRTFESTIFNSSQVCATLYLKTWFYGLEYECRDTLFKDLSFVLINVFLLENIVSVNEKKSFFKS